MKSSIIWELERITSLFLFLIYINILLIKSYTLTLFIKIILFIHIILGIHSIIEDYINNNIIKNLLIINLIIILLLKI